MGDNPTSASDRDRPAWPTVLKRLAIWAAFLGFLSKDIAATPGRIKPLAATRIKEARDLTRRVKARDDDTLPDDVTL